MCGRMWVNFETVDVKKKFDNVKVVSEVKPNYNLAPSQDIPVLVYGSLVLDNYKWGLIPHWSKDDSFKFKTINARAETLEDKPAYRDAYHKTRCVILCSGFYEWKDKKPFAFQAGEIMILAGLYSEWKDKKTCTVVTCEANKFMKDYHHRMPVILDEKEINIWLDPNSEKDNVERLLKPYGGGLKNWRVSIEVNNVKNNKKKLVEKKED
jgi:putative SOS response-associated peptidase YedK